MACDRVHAAMREGGLVVLTIDLSSRLPGGNSSEMSRATTGYSHRRGAWSGKKVVRQACRRMIARVAGSG